MNPELTRSTLPACLAATGRARVLDAARLLGLGLQVQPLQPAESGLALMQWRDAVMHQPFYLGEVPLSLAAVSLACGAERVEGGAAIMADDAELAQALAILDGVWAHGLPGAESVETLAREGAALRARQRAERQAMLQRTRVDFSLLSEAEDEDAA